MFRSIETHNKLGQTSKMMSKANDGLSSTDLIDNDDEAEKKKDTQRKELEQSELTNSDLDPIASRKKSPLPNKPEDQLSIQATSVTDDVTLSFPQRLMEILENEDHKEIISWLPEGRSFMIHKKNDLEKEILPKYFQKKSKYSSFTRKLNRWGFQRVARGPETGAYYHRLFQRGEYRLCMRMSCGHKSTAVSTSAANERTAEPYASSAPGNPAPYYATPFQGPFASLPPHHRLQSGHPVGQPMQQYPFVDPHYGHQPPHHMYPYLSQAPCPGPCPLLNYKNMMESYSGGGDVYHVSDHQSPPQVDVQHPSVPYEYGPPIPSSDHEWNESTYPRIQEEHHPAEAHSLRERGQVVSHGGEGPQNTFVVYPKREPATTIYHPSHHRYHLHAEQHLYPESGVDDNVKEHRDYHQSP